MHFYSNICQARERSRGNKWRSLRIIVWKMESCRRSEDNRSWGPRETIIEITSQKFLTKWRWSTARRQWWAEGIQRNFGVSMLQIEIEYVQYKWGLGGNKWRDFLRVDTIPDDEEAQVVAVCIVGSNGNERKLLSLDLMRSGYWKDPQTAWRKRL